VNVSDVLADLTAEQDALDALVDTLADADLMQPTASAGWSVADQIAHLAYFDRAAAIAIEDPTAFPALAVELLDAAGSDDVDDLTLGPYRTLPRTELIETWRSNREALGKAAARLADDDRVEWYGPSMGSKSFLTARLMECWAHGQDIAVATNTNRVATDRLVHIARLGFITRGWSYVNRGLDVPTDPVSVSLTAPSGAMWKFGDASAIESISGSAEDFCLVVTQRIHVDDTDLIMTPLAREWLIIAQAYAGPAAEGPHSQAE
jgi:uncharacterized protein (TIGR03084 family)